MTDVLDLTYLDTHEPNEHLSGAKFTSYGEVDPDIFIRTFDWEMVDGKETPTEAVGIIRREDAKRLAEWLLNLEGEQDVRMQ